MDKFSQETRWAVGTFANVDDPEAQNALLHQIFTRILSSKATSRHISVFEEVVMTLYRLFLDQEWEPARTFFYILTGTLINPERPVLSIDLNLFFRVGYVSFLHLDPRTINGECDKTCLLLNVLWFNAEDYYDNDSDTDSDDKSSEYSSTSSSGTETLSSRGSTTSGSVVSDSASTISSSDSASTVGSKEHDRGRSKHHRSARSSRSSGALKKNLHRKYKSCACKCVAEQGRNGAVDTTTPPPLTSQDNVD